MRKKKTGEADTNVIKIEWPWTTIPLACYDSVAHDVKSSLGAGHPLAKKELAPEVRHEEKEIVVVSVTVHSFEQHMRPN